MKRLSINTFLILTLVAMFCMSFYYQKSFAASLKDNEKALNMIADFAGRLCKDIPLQGHGDNFELSGSAKAELNGIIKQLANLGIDGAIKYQNIDYEGVLQKDLVNALKDSTNCRLQIWNDLKDKLISSDISPVPPTTPQPGTDPVPVPLLPGQSISYQNKQIEIPNDRARYGLVPFVEHTSRKYGVGEIADSQIKIILAPKYDEVIIAEQFDPTAAKMGIIDARKGKLWGMFDRTGRTVTTISYDHIFPFHDGFAVVTRRGKEGIININGQVVVPTVYDQAGRRSGALSAYVNDMATVGRDGKFGFVNKAGKLVVPPMLDYPTNYGQWGNPNTARAKSNGKWVTCDKSGNCRFD